MKIEVIPSPYGEDVMLKIYDTWGSHTIMMTRQELHQHDWVIRKYLENQPFRALKDATGGRK